MRNYQNHVRKSKTIMIWRKDKAYLFFVFSLFVTLGLQVPTNNFSVGISVYQLARAGILAVVGVTVFIDILSNRPLSLIKNKSNLSYFLIFILVSILSSFYSVSKFVSFVKSFELLIDWMVISYLYKLATTEKKLFFYWRFLIVLLAALPVFYLIVTFLSGKPLVQEISGITIWSGYGSRNTISAISTIIIMICVSRYINSDDSKFKIVFILLLSFLLLFITASRSSILLLFIMLPYIFWVSNKKKLIIFYSVFIALAFLIILPVLITYFLRGQSIEVVSELSGRFYLWNVAFQVISDSPIIGHGYYAGSVLVKEFADGFSDYFSNVDNLFLEVAMWVGIIGLTPLVIFMIKASSLIYSIYIQAIYKNNILIKCLYIETSSVVLFTIFRSFFNPTIQSHHWNTIIFLLAVIVLSKIDNEAYSSKGIQ